MARSKKRGRSALADGEPQAQRQKTSPVSIVDLTEDNKENVPVDQSKRSAYHSLSPLSPPTRVATPQATAVAIERADKAKRKLKINDIRAVMTPSPDYVFVVESAELMHENYFKEEEPAPILVSVNRTLDGALRAAVRDLNETGLLERVLQGPGDGETSDDGEEDDQSEKRRSMNALLNAAELVDDGDSHKLEIHTEDWMVEDILRMNIQRQKIGK
jgi:hypothetical protein